mmetsp:Transcript_7232/g.12212  ORF Transcript_7232/g.12212 Transcript_7232/m.12212 type:complete len:172 (-) Transcript_7232:511-1026(-)
MGLANQEQFKVDAFGHKEASPPNAALGSGGESDDENVIDQEYRKLQNGEKLSDRSSRSAIRDDSPSLNNGKVLDIIAKKADKMGLPAGGGRRQQRSRVMSSNAKSSGASGATRPPLRDPNLFLNSSLNDQGWATSKKQEKVGLPPTNQRDMMSQSQVRVPFQNPNQAQGHA